MNIKDTEEKMDVLANRAANSTNSNDALKYSQAALNLAHAHNQEVATRKEGESELIASLKNQLSAANKLIKSFRDTPNYAELRL